MALPGIKIQAWISGRHPGGGEVGDFRGGKALSCSVIKKQNRDICVGTAAHKLPPEVKPEIKLGPNGEVLNSERRRGIRRGQFVTRRVWITLDTNTTCSIHNSSRVSRVHENDLFPSRRCDNSSIACTPARPSTSPFAYLDSQESEGGSPTSSVCSGP